MAERAKNWVTIHLDAFRIDEREVSRLRGPESRHRTQAKNRATPVEMTVCFFCSRSTNSLGTSVVSKRAKELVTPVKTTNFVARIAARGLWRSPTEEGHDMSCPYS